MDPELNAHFSALGDAQQFDAITQLFGITDVGRFHGV